MRNIGKRLHALERLPQFQPRAPVYAPGESLTDQFENKLVAAGMTREGNESWADATTRFFGITMRELKEGSGDAGAGSAVRIATDKYSYEALTGVDGLSERVSRRRREKPPGFDPAAGRGGDALRS
jgi:tRNA(Ile2) C34 agmatinyltransferase TiaS